MTLATSPSTTYAKKIGLHAANLATLMVTYLQRRIAEELKRRKLKIKELEKLPKICRMKVEITKQLRKETPLTLGWIAEHLKSGIAGTMGVMLHRLERESNDKSKDVWD